MRLSRRFQCCNNALIHNSQYDSVHTGRTSKTSLSRKRKRTLTPAVPGELPWTVVGGTCVTPDAADTRGIEEITDARFCGRARTKVLCKEISTKSRFTSVARIEAMVTKTRKERKA